MSIAAANVEYYILEILVYTLYVLKAGSDNSYYTCVALYGTHTHPIGY